MPSYTAIVTDQQCVFISGCGCSSTAYVVRILQSTRNHARVTLSHAYIRMCVHWEWGREGNWGCVHKHIDNLLWRSVDPTQMVEMCLIQCHVVHVQQQWKGWNCGSLWMYISALSSINKQDFLFNIQPCIFTINMYNYTCNSSKVQTLNKPKRVCRCLSHHLQIAMSCRHSYSVVQPFPSTVEHARSSNLPSQTDSLPLEIWCH